MSKDFAFKTNDWEYTVFVIGIVTGMVIIGGGVIGYLIYNYRRKSASNVAKANVQIEMDKEAPS